MAMSKDEKGTVNILKEVPYINNHEELAQYLKPLYIIENCISDEAEYNILRTKLLNLLRGSFVIRECREYPIKFKFRKSDKKVIVAINKMDVKDAKDNIYDFYELGFDTYIPISSIHNIGYIELLSLIS